MRFPHTAFIGIGANLGEPLAQCQEAVRALKELMNTRLASCSLFYRSPPLVAPGTDAEGIPFYVNAVCRLETRLEPKVLLQELQNIEKKMGRARKTKWESRLIDLDLLFYDQLILNTESLILPHPEIQNRPFVLVPLVEIAPEWTHPVLHCSVQSLVKIDSTLAKIGGID